jgi:hypothetical protein
MLCGLISTDQNIVPAKSQDQNMRACSRTPELAVSAESEDTQACDQNLVQLTDQNLGKLTIRT